jgi:hypothetical protein
MYLQQTADMFHTTHKAKTQQVVKSQGQRCGDMDLVSYLDDVNGQLHYPPTEDIDRSLNEVAADKIRDYRADYNNRPSNAISSIPAVARTSTRLHCELVRNFFLQTHREIYLFC